ncbi:MULTISPECIES: hypothetical protein [Sphingomonadaceae]|jgi:hypothetical protein|uniref:Uncharacterized protein n=1 Tax=Novosphingobium resinovorum TaxID=158500 RepID=A0A031JWJ4_9SPHN|nr:MULTISPECIES: hypothetical protein [Sphingomonadaceae]EJU13298.1 hypothetical protein LH128_09596 [Sphingomonas sp. LH128]EZP82151.1 hypothetical protein BV97_02174 [Novosphingobium resinovorum]GLK44286.1 hypothetical protein GCM10017612_22060 [Novosphingobium resinovorum]
MAHTGTASLTINELREFASFSPSEQRYIRRSLDIGLGRQDAFKLWARDEDELASIRKQYVAYQDLKALRAMRPDDYSFDDVDAFMGKLVRMAAFDLAQERLTSFSAFRFLYERLLGGWARPWLPGAFCGAAALPQIRPDRRRTLLHSISEAAATAPGWSDREPSFYPEFIEKEAA